MEDKPIIELKDVTCSAEDGTLVVEGVSLRLNGGEKALIVAQSARDKAVFSRLLAGIVEPDEGEVLLFGQSIGGAAPEELAELRMRVGFMIQDNVLISNLKIIENVALPVLYHTGASYDEAMEKAASLLAATGFSGDPWALPGPLSSGARKKAVIARALILDPQVVVCENIFEGLTDTEKRELTALLVGFSFGIEDRLLVLSASGTQGLEALEPMRRLRLENSKVFEDQPII